jgi:hypothetical protein
VLKQLHDELDEAVRDAHAPLLTRLVALNHERTAEEKRGLIRWLRPDYQNPTTPSDCRGSAYAESRPPLQATLAGTDPDSSSSNQKSRIHNHQSSIDPSSPFDWPERLPEQVAIIRKLIGDNDNKVVAPHPEALSARFGRKNKKRTEQIEGILEVARPR